MIQGNAFQQTISQVPGLEMNQISNPSIQLSSQGLVEKQLLGNQSIPSAPVFYEKNPFLPIGGMKNNISGEYIPERQNSQLQGLQQPFQYQPQKSEPLTKIQLNFPKQNNPSYSSAQTSFPEQQKPQIQEDHFERKIQLNDEEIVYFQSSLIQEIKNQQDTFSTFQPNDDIQLQNSVQKLANNIIERTFTLNTLNKKITFKDTYHLISSADNSNARYQQLENALETMKTQKYESEQSKLIAVQKMQDVLSQYEAMLNERQQRLLASDQRIQWLTNQTKELNQQISKLTSSLSQSRQTQEELDKQVKLFSTMNDSLRQQLSFMMSQNNSMIQVQKPNNFQNSQNYCFPNNNMDHNNFNIHQNFNNNNNSNNLLNINPNNSCYTNNSSMMSTQIDSMNSPFGNMKNQNPNMSFFDMNRGFLTGNKNINDINETYKIRQMNHSTSINEINIQAATSNQNSSFQTSVKPPINMNSSMSLPSDSASSQECVPTKDPLIKMESSELKQQKDQDHGGASSSPKDPLQIIKSIKKEKPQDDKKKKDRKNIAKNFIKAFRSFFNNLAEQKELQDLLQAKGANDPAQFLQSLRTQFNQTVQTNNINNEFIIFLIQHPDLSDIFKFFINHRAEAWIQSSMLKDKEVHLESLALFQEAFKSNSALSKVKVNQHKNKKPIQFAPLV